MVKPVAVGLLVVGVGPLIVGEVGMNGDGLAIAVMLGLAGAVENRGMVAGADRLAVGGAAGIRGPAIGVGG